MLKLLFVVISYGTCVRALTWSNCSTDPTHDVVKVARIAANPASIVFPGDLHIDLNLTFTRVIEHVYLDFEMYRNILGFPLRLPCINGTSIGSCKNVDACRIFSSILRDPNHQGDYGHQAESLMLAALGHYIQCPLQPETVVLSDAIVKLDPIPSIVSLLTDGEYTIRIRAKESIDGPYTLGCLVVKATFGRDPNTVIG